ncbi:MAG: hypothetical protein RIS35_1072 [Pseudomonadota bacterium]|jgi:hypothetical protein
MFIALLLANAVVAATVCGAALLLLRQSVTGLLGRRLSRAAASTVWRSFVLLVFVAGIGLGTRFWDLERYASTEGEAALVRNLFVLELYKTGIGTMLLVAVAFVLLLLVSWLMSSGQRKD